MSFLTKLPRERYPSDAFSRFDPARDGFDRGTALALAWMSQLAYETDEPAKVAAIAQAWGMTIPPGAIVSEEVATPLPQASTQAVVALGAPATVIAFAGTDPLVLANWVTDFDIGMTTSGTANGFAVAAQAAWPKIRALLPNTVPAANAASAPPIFVTGHSLGGALAVLTAEKIDQQFPGAVRAVYTYGMPRAGNAAFASAYNQALGARTLRLAHGDDVVPTVAPSMLGFHHVGRYLHCERGGKFDAAALTPGFDSDAPQFVRGVSKQLKGMLLGPLSNVISMTARLKLVAALALGRGPSGMRTDAGGLVIELLPPPLRDHMPDRYIEAI
ncbi:MAG: lipase family protein [Proteobacteria bacterium]|nr:lipase family protein [Pseudomonadota bacterium]